MMKCAVRVVATVFLAAAPVFGEQWGDWAKYRGAVEHPALTIKAADLVRARENVKEYPWATAYVAKVTKAAQSDLARLTPEFIEHMIPATTPGSRIFTPCPACRDQHKPYLPQGQWVWDDQRPDEIKCGQCGTVFPNPKYPESVEVHTHWGHPQTLTFYGGKTFELFGYKQGRPSFTGNIRNQKIMFMSDVARTLAEAYALTGDERFAAGVKQILLRFADVYPYYLVHVGYGEYADMDPTVAANHIDNLPADEAVYPPNKPDRKLHTGFWTAGRATGTGMEAWFVRRVAGAYDLTASAKNVWTDAERRKVEKDLLLESTTLLTADTSINNKSVGNRSAAGLVGMCLGEPSLVRFGLEGFYKTVDDWFLPDGGTPETWAYAEMSLNGIEEMALASRGYSDPKGFKDAEGKRIDALDLYHQSAYGRVWQSMFNGMQGDLHYPPLADSYTFTTIGPRKAELMAANYPDRPEYLSLLKELCGTNGVGDASAALYYRAPGLEKKPAPPLKFTDYLWPVMRIGYLRTGPDGRESLLAMEASHWGNHHHDDSLNLYYWKQGHELLSDLGYLWDHPEKHFLGRTVAHNTVVLDEKDQIEQERGGDVELFATGEHAKVMRAKSNAYPQATAYERTCVLVDHGGGRNYVVDLFHVAGGQTQDYVFHGTNFLWTVDGDRATTRKADEKLYDFTDPRRIIADGVWHIDWLLDDEYAFDAWALPTDGETAYVADGWGQRDYKNSDVGVAIPYVVRRCTGGGDRTFASVFEGHPAGHAVVKNVRRLPAKDAQVVWVETTDGADCVISSRAGGDYDTPAGKVHAPGPVTVVSFRDKRATWRFDAPAK